MLEVKNLKKYFGEVRAVDDVTLSFEKGTLTSIIGPNGAGKTTLINLISGRLKPDGGRVIFQGRDITDLPAYERVKMGIARSFQLINIYNELTVFDNVRIAIISQIGKSLKLLSFLDRDLEISYKAEEILRLFNLYEHRNMLSKDVPHGEKKLLDVAMCFALNPKVILLDEPTSGVSATEKDGVMGIIEKAVRQTGVTAVVVEHDMDIVFSYSDRVIAMYQGKILADGTPEDIRGRDDVRSLILGELVK